MKGQGKARAETIIHLRAFALGVCPAWITLSSFILIAVMTREGLHVLSCLQAIRLACPSSMDAGGRPAASGSQTEDFIIHSNICSPSTSILLCCFLKSRFPQGDMERAGRHQPMQWVVHRTRTLRSGNWHHWKWAVRTAVLPSAEALSLFYWRVSASVNNFGEKWSLPSMEVCCMNSLEKLSRTKAISQCLCSQIVQKCLGPREKCLPSMTCFSLPLGLCSNVTLPVELTLSILYQIATYDHLHQITPYHHWNTKLCVLGFMLLSVSCKLYDGRDSVLLTAVSSQSSTVPGIQ